MATGSTTSGSQATSSMRKPLGMWKVASSSRGESGPAGWPGLTSAVEVLARRTKGITSTGAQQQCQGRSTCVVMSGPFVAASADEQGFGYGKFILCHRIRTTGTAFRVLALLCGRGYTAGKQKLQAK